MNEFILGEVMIESEPLESVMLTLYSVGPVDMDWLRWMAGRRVEIVSVEASSAEQ